MPALYSLWSVNAAAFVASSLTLELRASVRLPSAHHRTRAPITNCGRMWRRQRCPATLELLRFPAPFSLSWRFLASFRRVRRRAEPRFEPGSRSAQLWSWSAGRLSRSTWEACASDCKAGARRRRFNRWPCYPSGICRATRRRTIFPKGLTCCSSSCQVVAGAYPDAKWDRMTGDDRGGGVSVEGPPAHVS
jgi:hypothetical protein